MIVTSRDGNFIIEIDNRYFVKGKLPYQKRSTAEITLIGQKREISFESLAESIATCTIDGSGIIPNTINRKRYSRIEILLDSKFDEHPARSFSINNYSHYNDIVSALYNKKDFISIALSGTTQKRKKFGIFLKK